MAETHRLQLEWAERDKELAARTEEQGTIYSFDVTEQDMLDLASGWVNSTIKAMARSSLAWLDDDRRKAESEPVPKKRKRA